MGTHYEYRSFPQRLSNVHFSLAEVTVCHVYMYIHVCHVYIYMYYTMNIEHT